MYIYIYIYIHMYVYLQMCVGAANDTARPGANAALSVLEPWALKEAWHWTGRVLVDLLWDIKGCYGSLSVETVAVACRRHGFLMDIFVVAAQIRMARGSCGAACRWWTVWSGLRAAS